MTTFKKVMCHFETPASADENLKITQCSPTKIKGKKKNLRTGYLLEKLKNMNIGEMLFIPRPESWPVGVRFSPINNVRDKTGYTFVQEKTEKGVKVFRTA